MHKPSYLSVDHLPIEVIEQRFGESGGEVIFKIAMSGSSVEVFEDPLFRWLTFEDDITQTAILRRRPDDLLLAYTRAMMAALLFQPQPHSAVVLGLGGGSLVRFLAREFPQLRLTAVDLSETMSHVAREYFGLPPDSSRFHLHFANALEFVRDTRSRTDVIFVDLFGPDEKIGDPARGVRFYANCRARLNAGGILVINLLLREDPDIHAALAPVREAFVGRVLYMHPNAWGNFIVFAFKDTSACTDFKSLRKTARQLQYKHALAFPRFLNHLREVNAKTRHGFVLDSTGVHVNQRREASECKNGRRGILARR